ncbi:MAG TPA: hypothetical protein DDW38_09250, partial [Psychrobacter sp.]|nr:hypothetical protein [Psychrobacter sp.]
MASSWQQIKLGQLAKITMGQSPKGELCNSIGEGVPLLNGPTEFGSSYPTATQFTTDPKRFSEKGDLLFCVRGSTTGRMNWSNQEYAIGRGLAAFKHFEGEDYKHFLRAVIEFKLPELLASATGSTFPNVSKNQLNDLEIFVPPLSEQKAIAHILGTLDDKIELNRQMNETLEAMAQALFKSWFVDFDPVIDNALLAGKAIPEPLKERAELRQAQLDSGKAKTNSEINDLFPSEFEFTEELGWIPKGWSDGNLSDVSFVKGGYAFKSKDFTNEGLPVIKIKNINDDRTVNVYDVQYIPEGIAKNSKDFFLETGDLIMAMTGATVGKFGLLVAENAQSYLLNQRVAKFTSSIDQVSKVWFIYCFLNQKSTINHIVNIAEGSAQPNISATSIMATPSIVPTIEVINRFGNLVDGYFSKMIEIG